jgi:predicted HD phosphohydrolase
MSADQTVDASKTREKARRRLPRRTLRTLKSSVKRSLRTVLGEQTLWRVAQVSASGAGIDLRSHLTIPASFGNDADTIIARHAAQTIDVVAALRKRYAEPVLGRVPIWSLIEKLAQCIDPADTGLYCVSQQVHVLQILEAMERDGVATRELVLAALLHDIGKILLLTGEAPEHVIGMNEPIGRYEPGIGLDNCVLQWNHDEFAYSRLRDHLPDGLAWLIRYHSIVRASCERYMDARDREYADRYLTVFARYDQGSKSPYALPKKRIDEYRDVIEEAFPRGIIF